MWAREDSPVRGMHQLIAFGGVQGYTLQGTAAALAALTDTQRLQLCLLMSEYGWCKEPVPEPPHRKLSCTK